MTKPQLTKIVSREPQHDQIEAAYTLIARMKDGTEARDKLIVAEVWRVMFDNLTGVPRHGMTARQKLLLENIVAYTREHGVSPTYAEIGKMMGVSRADAFNMCKGLNRRKLITMGGGWRELRVVENPPLTKR